MSWVFEHSQATGNDRLVLLAIADQSDADGFNAYPSIPTIAHMSRVPERTVQRCLERLEAGRELLVNRPPRQGRGHHNTYAVVMDREREQLLAELGWVSSEPKGDTLTPFCRDESTPPDVTLPGLLMTPEGCQSGLLMTSPGGVIPITQDPTTPPPVDLVTTTVPVDSRGPGEGDVDLADRAAVANFASYLRIVRRDDHGLPTAAWTTKRVAKAISDAIDEGYDPAAIPAALRELAADPETNLPGRLAGAGPWWDAADRERRQATARSIIEHAERKARQQTEDRRRTAQLVDARRQRQQELFEGLDDSTLEDITRQATVLVDEQEERGPVGFSAEMRARLIGTQAMEIAVADGWVPALERIELEAANA